MCYELLTQYSCDCPLPKQGTLKQCYYAEREHRVCPGPLLLGKLPLVIRPEVDLCDTCTQRENWIMVMSNNDVSVPKLQHVGKSARNTPKLAEPQTLRYILADASVGAEASSVTEYVEETIHWRKSHEVNGRTTLESVGTT